MERAAHSVVVFLLRLFTWLGFRLRIYYSWSRAYRLLFERAYRRRPPIPEFPDLQAVTATLARMRWDKDGWEEMGDAIGSARAAYYRNVDGCAIGDCDEFAVFAADRIDDLRRRGELAELELRDGEIGVLSVPWLSGWRLGGHNVCAFSYYDARRQVQGRRWAHVGNWYAGQVQWGFESLEAVVRAVSAARDGLAWSYARAGDLALLRMGWRA